MCHVSYLTISQWSANCDLNPRDYFWVTHRNKLLSIFAPPAFNTCHKTWQELHIISAAESSTRGQVLAWGFPASNGFPRKDWGNRNIDQLVLSVVSCGNRVREQRTHRLRWCLVAPRDRRRLKFCVGVLSFQPEHKIKGNILDPDLCAHVGVGGVYGAVSVTVVAAAGARCHRASKSVFSEILDQIFRDFIVFKFVFSDGQALNS